MTAGTAWVLRRVVLVCLSVAAGAVVGVTAGHIREWSAFGALVSTGFVTTESYLREWRHRAGLRSTWLCAGGCCVTASYLTLLSDPRFTPEVAYAVASALTACALIAYLISLVFTERPDGSSVLRGDIIATFCLGVVTFILSFAILYLLLQRFDATSFTRQLNGPVDAIYVAVTTFTTVGPGELQPHTELARGVLTTESVSSLLLIALCIARLVR